MDTLSIFEYGSKQLRVFGTPEDPWWLASEVCAALELENVSQALDRLDDDEKGDIILNDATSAKRSYKTVNEPGLYALILGSRKPSTKAFKRWIRHEVLPSIRKTGSYSTGKVIPANERKTNALQLAKLLDNMYGHIVTPHELAIAKVNTIGEVHPHLDAPLRKSAEILPPLAANEKLYTPTNIGEQFEPKLSGRAVNNALEDLGLQESYRTPQKKHKKWRATERGEEHASIKIQPKQNSKGSVEELRWKESVVPLIQKFIDDRAH